MTLTLMRGLLVLALSFVTALGAPAAPPLCAQNCLDSTTNNIPTGGCTSRDTACLCSSDSYTLAVKQCILLNCHDAVSSQTGLNYLVTLCDEATMTAAPVTTTITRTITSTSSRQTNVVTQSTPLPETILSSSHVSLHTSISTTIQVVTVSGTRSLASSTNASSNAVTENSTDQENDQQRSAIIASVVGIVALTAILAIIFVVLRHRKNKKKEKEKSDQHLQFVGEEVGSPSAAVHPWRATMLPFTSFAHLTASDHQTTDHRLSEPLPRYDGPGPILPEKYAPPKGASSSGSVVAPPARPHHPDSWHQQELPPSADDYHSIGSSFLRGS